jgi:hypothetical protein
MELSVLINKNYSFGLFRFVALFVVNIIFVSFKELGGVLLGSFVF